LFIFIITSALQYIKFTELCSVLPNLDDKAIQVMAV